MKECRICKNLLDKKMFHVNTKTSDGLCSDCKNCVEERRNSKRQTANARRTRREIRLKAINNYGGKCVNCGFSDIRALQFDHIFGTGSLEKTTGTNPKYYRRIIEDNGKNFQLLCANCNWIKRYENGEYVGGLKSLGIIIPHYPFNKEINQDLNLCRSSLCNNGNIYIVINNKIGYGAACNFGIDVTFEDFLCISNNDIILVEGNLKDLLIENAFSVPKIIPTPIDNNPRSFFCFPRWIYDHFLEKDGYFFDERFKGGYFEDDDLLKRIKRDRIKIEYIESVVVVHKGGGGTTMKYIGEQEYFDINKKRYDEKWSNI